MQLQIDSKKFGRVITFTRPSGTEYLYADVNGKAGTLGLQLHRNGSALAYGGGDESEFQRLVRNWYRWWIA